MRKTGKIKEPDEKETSGGWNGEKIRGTNMMLGAFEGHY